MSHLDQRVARVHRIGTTNAVRVILLVTENSIEERILALHDTKRDVFENIWAENGTDLIAAPGGSGALREMLRTLLADSLEAQDLSTEVAELEALQPPAAGPSGESSGKPATGSRPQSQARNGAPAPGATSLVMPAPQAAATTDSAVDAAALAHAVASVAPTLPPEHRRSLATVFQALAEALSDGLAPLQGEEKAQGESKRPPTG